MFKCSNRKWKNNCNSKKRGNWKCYYFVYMIILIKKYWQFNSLPPKKFLLSSHQNIIKSWEKYLRNQGDFWIVYSALSLYTQLQRFSLRVFLCKNESKKEKKKKICDFPKERKATNERLFDVCRFWCLAFWTFDDFEKNGFIFSYFFPLKMWQWKSK